MFDMLFVTSSHPLSVSIYSLDNRCKQLAERDRTEVKEKINPEHRFVSCKNLLFLNYLYNQDEHVDIVLLCICMFIKSNKLRYDS